MLLVPCDAYTPVIVFIALAFFISCALIGISWIRGPHRPSPEKLAPYECGFDAFSSPRRKIDIHFYLVSILFIVFDLEIAFLFPWAVSLKEIGVLGFFSMLGFLSVLTVGFVYEWKKGALEWRV